MHSAGSVLFSRLSLRGVAREASASRESTCPKLVRLTLKTAHK
ncbi:hypothetical protein [Klebsiella pneumoniae IS43]|uniref:Uncharacterized protein n=1 Tax=Klebsiella pneumoniae IS43 TaxID=1432552 RepID=W1DPR4_KLEPN|nr:hypothetical protein [Klebsiella pneumoniae IS43]